MAKLELLAKNKNFSEDTASDFMNKLFMISALKHNLEEQDELVLTLLMHRPKIILFDYHLKPKSTSLLLNPDIDDDELMRRNKLTFGGEFNFFFKEFKINFYLYFLKKRLIHNLSPFGRLGNKPMALFDEV